MTRKILTLLGEIKRVLQVLGFLMSPEARRNLLPNMEYFEMLPCKRYARAFLWIRDGCYALIDKTIYSPWATP